MATDTTFADLWKRLLVYAPDLPLPLAQEFVNTSYSRALSAGPWSGLRARGEFKFNTPEQVSGTVTNGSATVTGATEAVAAHVGRQFYKTSAPFYTIIAQSTGTSYTLDRPWGGASAVFTISPAPSAGATVENVFVEAPSDFLHFISVVDPSNKWRLHRSFLPEHVDNWDPGRTSTGSSWIVIPASPSPVTATLGRPRYEFWPRPGAEKYYTFSYIKRPALMSAATDTPIYPIRGDVVRHGALSELSMWPGTEERKNPFFNLDLARVHEEGFQKDLAANLREDQEIAQTAISFSDEDLPLAPIDGEFLQSHAFVI